MTTIMHRPTVAAIVGAAVLIVPLAAYAESWYVTSSNDRACTFTSRSPDEFEQDARRRGDDVKTETLGTGAILIEIRSLTYPVPTAFVYFRSKTLCDQTVRSIR